MTQQRKKKAVKYHFVDMNDPDRYKKLKVARACDFCRKRKSKCDIGIPGSGTCSNCKKAKNVCVFSPVSSNTTSHTNSKKQDKALESIPQWNNMPIIDNSIDYCPDSVPQCLSTVSKENFSSSYQAQNPLFSLDYKSHCNYEKHTSSTYIYSHISTNPTPNEITPYPRQIEQELFNTYFSYVHPFYPILDRFHILQTLQYDPTSIPDTLKWAVMAIALRFTQQHRQSASLTATYRHYASLNLDRSSHSLSSLQTILLLYKLEEIMTPVGAPLSTLAVSYLYEAQDMLKKCLLQDPEKEDASLRTVHDEFLCRAGWVLFINVATSSSTDSRWRELLDNCHIPSQIPSLTETEQYDKGELNTTYNLVHLINIILLYSRMMCFLSDQGTLFAERAIVSQHFHELDTFATGLDVWKTTLPKHISLSLAADPPVLYSAQSRYSTDKVLHQDSFKTASFTSYLCLIHDILDLLISIHRAVIIDASGQRLSSYAFDNLPKKVTQVCYRAHSLTVVDMGESYFSRLASIQGSRLIAFGVTLSIQAYNYYQEEKKDGKSLDNVKKLSSLCLLAFQIFDNMTLTPQFCMTIQTLRTQMEARQRLNLLNATTTEHVQASNNSNNSSSTFSTPGSGQHIPAADDSQRNDYNYFSTVETVPFTDVTTRHRTYCYSSSSTIASSNDRLLDQLSSGDTTNHYSQQEESWQRNDWSEHHVTYYYDNKYDSHKLLSFQKDNVEQEQEPVTPPSLDAVSDSYFQSRPQQYASIAIASLPFDSFNLTLPVLNSKSCKNEK
ncbi:MAG: hypothetical protein EXX96DRAFT_583220 [Benjaminiella poitrasii]|nr:MAG: hypothetical protein EXX96DRAFT_583220 [Benjaminiella poitrasii]